jgi:hypothetical protein
VALGRFQPLEGSRLGGFWKEKEKYHFHLFSLSPQQILFEFYFIDFKVYFIMVQNCYFMPSLPFP